MMYHAKNNRKKKLIGRKMLWIIKYLEKLAIRPTASSSPENSHFSQKLISSCTEASTLHSEIGCCNAERKTSVEG